MTLNAEQSRALIDAIFVADSADVLGELRRQARRELGRDVVPCSFLEVLIDVRLSTLERANRRTGRAHGRPSG
jgi:hypothetical protein